MSSAPRVRDQDVAAIITSYETLPGMKALALDLRDEREAHAVLGEEYAKAVRKLDKVASWLERQADVDEQHGKDNRFESLSEAYRADAKMRRATAADLRATISSTQAREVLAKGVTK
jgi:hypothetical protein